MAKPTPEQLAKINRFTKTPVGEDDVYVHPFRLLGTGYIPSRFLQFDRSLMDIYLGNVNNGDVVQIADHSFGGFFNTNITLPFGRFFEGELVQDGDKTQLDGYMFMPVQSKTYIQDFTTDDISQQIDAGILFDSSVSVTWGLSECSVCHNNIWDGEKCSHWPGRFYEVDDKQVQCFIIAKPAPVNDKSCMIENSIVCAGAYPDAGVLSQKPHNNGIPERAPTTQFNNIADLKLVAKSGPVFCCLSSTSATFHVAGENMRDASELHQMYHQMQKTKELPEGWTFGTLNAKHKESVKALLDMGCEHSLIDALDGTLSADLKAKSTKGSEQTLGMTDEERQQFDALTAENAQFKTDLSTKDAEIANLTAQVAALTPRAELGDKYRFDAIENALKAGVRDQGNDFDEETYREMFGALDIEKINSFAEKWEASAQAKLGVPPAKTETENLSLPDGQSKPEVDPALYKVGR